RARVVAADGRVGPRIGWDDARATGHGRRGGEPLLERAELLEMAIESRLVGRSHLRQEALPLRGDEIQDAALAAQLEVELRGGAVVRRFGVLEQRLECDLRARLRLDLRAAVAVRDVLASGVARAAQVPRRLRAEHQRIDGRLALVELGDDLIRRDAAAHEAR